MFDPNQQVPKSKQELVDQYGYDIRQEESSPRLWTVNEFATIYFLLTVWLIYFQRLGLRRPFGRGRSESHVTPSKDGDAYSRPRGRGGVASRGCTSERGSAPSKVASPRRRGMRKVHIVRGNRDTYNPNCGIFPRR
jgi:hypothetical protein